MFIYSFTRKRAPDRKLIIHKSHLYAHGGTQKWGVNYWDTYSSVVNWVSARAMLTLSIIKKLHTKSVDFVLDYIQYDVQIDISMVLPIGFGVEGVHTRE